MDPIDKFLKQYSYKFDKGYPDMDNPKDKEMLFEFVYKLTEKKSILSEGEKGYDDRIRFALRLENDEEIPLFNMSEAGEGIYMKNCLIKNTIPTSGDKLIYVYDFLSMWTFLIELMDTAEHQSGTSYPSLIYSHGMLPEDAPDKQFEAESENDLEWESEDEDLYDDNAEDLWN